MRETMITVAGNVGGAPTFFAGKEGEEPRLVLRMATTPRIRDRVSGEWRDGNTSWYDVWLRGRMALNAQQSIGKGDAVLVSGTVEFRDWQDGDKSGTNAVISARAFGPDLGKYPVVITRVRLGQDEAGDGASNGSTSAGAWAANTPDSDQTASADAPAEVEEAGALEESGYTEVAPDGSPF